MQQVVLLLISIDIIASQRAAQNIQHLSKENHASGKKGIELDSSTLVQMKSCLDSLKQMRVDELKEIEKNLDMNHPTNIQKGKRAELILQDYIEKPDVMLHIFEQISLTEFDVFLKLYASGGTVSRSIEDYLEYETLEKYGLVSIDVDYSGSIIVDMSIELVTCLSEMLPDGSVAYNRSDPV